MRSSRRTAKSTKTTAKKTSTRDLKPRRTEGARGGATNTTRFDPYKNFKF